MNIMAIVILIGCFLWWLLDLGNIEYCHQCKKTILTKPWTKCGSKLFCSPYCFKEWLYKERRIQDAKEKLAQEKEK